MSRRSNRNRRPRAVGSTNIGRINNPAALAPDPKFQPVKLAGAKEGWRAWAVDRKLPAYGLAPKLYSVTHTYHWAPKRKAEAFCEYCANDETGESTVPGVDCSCGFYSAKSLKHLMRMGYHSYGDIDEANQFKIVGQVANWGKVIEGTQGWRSQYSYPTYLMLPFEMGHEFGARIRDAYGCQVRLLNFLKAPEEITDEFIADLLAPQPKLKPIQRPKSTGRRVAHKDLKFNGRTASEPYERQGERMVDVIWDVNPGRKVAIRIQHLYFEPV
jgi:hypothetical protein